MADALASMYFDGVGFHDAVYQLIAQAGKDPNTCVGIYDRFDATVINEIDRPPQRGQAFVALFQDSSFLVLTIESVPQPGAGN